MFRTTPRKTPLASKTAGIAAIPPCLTSLLCAKIGNNTKATAPLRKQTKGNAAAAPLLAGLPKDPRKVIERFKPG